MLEWEVAEEEERDRESEAGTTTGRPRRWRALLLSLFFISLVTGGGFWLVTYLQERQLRADITQVIEAEARVMAVGAMEQAQALVDPRAPGEWQRRYYRYLGRPSKLPGAPQVHSVQMEGNIARVAVIWPHPDGVQRSGRAAEWRAYRLVGGTWRRTPLPVEADELITAESEHFILRAAPDDLKLLTESPDSKLDLEALRKHLSRHWPASTLEPYPITIIVRYREFGDIVQETVSRRTLQANSPRLNYVVSKHPLSSQAFYRLRLTEAIVRKLLPHPSAEPPTGYHELYEQLQWTEARWWALDEERHRVLRNGWRKRLNGAWYLPLDSLGEPAANGTAVLDRQLCMNLLMDYLITTYGREIPGRLAARLLEHPEADPAHLLADVTGTPVAKLETGARAYARVND